MSKMQYILQELQAQVQDLANEEEGEEMVELDDDTSDSPPLQPKCLFRDSDEEDSARDEQAANICTTTT